MKYSREDIRTIVDLAFKGAHSNLPLLAALHLSHSELAETEQLFQHDDVLLGLEVIFTQKD